MKEKIPTIEQQNEFKKFLEGESNNKVIFSAKFGSGKTTFLKDFFENNQQFTPVYLYPVNYSVACNEDIFELIKYDILLQLLRWEDIENYLVDIPKSLSAQFHFLNDPFSFIVSIAKAIPKLSSEIEVAQNTILGVEKLNNVVKSLNKNKETKHINHFIQSLHEKAGNIFEHNIITSIIRSIIDRYKTDNAEKKIVLVIDDMDRIDPEHIFRIMNVFAAHNDIEDEEKNKFNFDKIITVCDINNIQYIYHAKYGDNTDFNGYISKFHSRTVFEFDIREAISKQIGNIFKTTEIGKELLTKNERIFSSLMPLLAEFVLQKELAIRKLKHIPKQLEMDEGNYYKYFPDTERMISYLGEDEVIFQVYSILKVTFGGKENLCKSILACKKIKEKIRLKKSPNHFSNLIAEIFCLFDKEKITQEVILYDLPIECKYQNEYILEIKGIGSNLLRQPNYPYINQIRHLKTNDENPPFPLWDILIKVFEHIDDIKEYTRRRQMSQR